jgi:hypothetical protein
MNNKEKNVPDPFPKEVPPELGLQMYTRMRSGQIQAATIFIVAAVKGW